MTQPIITATNLTHQYGNFTAVHGIDFEVHPGEIYGLLGTNGAGKITTMEILEGLQEPTSGTVEVCGMDPKRDRHQLRPYLGIMLQSGGLPTQLTAQQTIEMWAGTCAEPLDPTATLAEVGLSHRGDVTVGKLSGGEQRRLDLACALVGDPNTIFLDEPTTGLDPESRRNVWRLLQQLKSRGVTMMLTTHYLEEAEKLCDRIAILHHGRIALEGTVQELASQAEAEITATLPTNVPPLPGLGGADVSVDKNVDTYTVTVTTSRLQAHATELLAWASEHGIELGQFQARPASLENVFLAIADN